MSQLPQSTSRPSKGEAAAVWIFPAVAVVLVSLTAAIKRKAAAGRVERADRVEAAVHAAARDETRRLEDGADVLRQVEARLNAIEAAIQNIEQEIRREPDESRESDQPAEHRQPGQSAQPSFAAQSAEPAASAEPGEPVVSDADRDQGAGLVPGRPAAVALGGGGAAGADGGSGGVRSRNAAGDGEDTIRRLLGTQTNGTFRQIYGEKK